MRKLMTLLWVCLIIAAVLLPVSADGVDLRISDAEAKPGEVVYLTVSLSQPIQGSSMGIRYSFDEKVLKVLTHSCSWEQSGMIKDFSKKDNTGVWAAGETVALQGDVCVLAFEVLPSAKLTQSRVQCTLVVENNGKQEYSAEATVSMRCEHEYGAWSRQAGNMHSRTCQLCQKTQSESHSWDAGVNKQDGEKIMKVYTCTVCKATLEYDVTAGGEVADPPRETQPGEPTEPESPAGPGSPVEPETSTKPSAPEATVPEQDKPVTNVPEQNEKPEAPGTDGSALIGVPVDPDKNVHSNLDEPSATEQVEEHNHEENATDPVEHVDRQDPSEPTVHDHEHAVADPGNSTATGIAVIAALLILVGGAIVYIKRK